MPQPVTVRRLRFKNPFSLSLLLVTTCFSTFAQADPEKTSLFTPSDFPRLASDGLALPKGKYTVKVWTEARRSWTLNLDGATLSLKSQTEGDDTSLRWQTLSEADVSGDEPLKIVMPSQPAQPKKAKADDPDLPPPPVPALLVITSQPDYNPDPVLKLIRGRIESIAPPDDPRRTQARTNKEGADFKAPATASDWEKRAKVVREQLLVTMGLWPPPPKTPLNPRVFGKIERDGYTIEKVVLETLPGFLLSGNLYRPIGKTGRRPAILSPHGHAKEGRINEDTQKRCARWAKLGCIVFMYDMIGYVDSKPFGHAFLDDRLRRAGLSLVTLQTWDSIRALDWLSAQPDVDPARIGCTGESGGATQTILITAIDTRIKAAAPVVMVSDSFQGGCFCENCAGLRIGTDNVEIAALAAPRPLKLVGASGDWTAKTMIRAYPALVDVYKLTGVADRVSADVFDFPHNYNKTSRNAVYPFLSKWLLGLDETSTTLEGDLLVESAADLQTFNETNPRPPTLKSSAELEDHLIQTLSTGIEHLAPADSVSAWDASRFYLKTSHSIRVGLVNPPPANLHETELRRSSHDGVTVVHVLAGRKETGENIPLIRLIPSKPTGRVTVLADPLGKRALVETSGRFVPQVRALLDLGQGVVGFDPLFRGESVDPSAPALQRPRVVHVDAYNRSLPADQMQDLATVLSWVRSRDDVREVSLIGQGRSGLQVLLALPLLEGLARTAVDLDNFKADQTPFPAEGDLPGLDQFGGLKAAAALAAPAPLWIFKADASFPRAWPEKSYQLAESTQSFRVDADRPSVDDLARWIDTGDQPEK